MKPTHQPLAVWLLLLALTGTLLSSCAKQEQEGVTPGPGPRDSNYVVRPDNLLEEIPAFSFETQPAFVADHKWLASGKSQTGSADFWPKEQVGGYHVRPFGTLLDGSTIILSGPTDATWKAEILLTDSDYRERGTPVGVLSPEHPSWTADVPGDKGLMIKSWAAPGTSPEITLNWKVTYTPGIDSVRVSGKPAAEGLPPIEYVLAQSGVAGRELFYQFGTPIWVLDTDGGYVLQMVDAGTLSPGQWTLSTDGPASGWAIQVVLMDQPHHPSRTMLPSTPKVDIEVGPLTPILLKVQGQPGADLSKLKVDAKPKGQS